MQKLTAFQVIKTVLGVQTLIILIAVMFIGQIDGLPSIVTGLAVLIVLFYAGRRLGRTRVISEMRIDEKKERLELWGYLYRGTLEARKSSLVLEELDKVRWIPSTWYKASPEVEFLAKDGDSYTVVVSPDHIGADDVIELNQFLAAEGKTDPKSSSKSNTSKAKSSGAKASTTPPKSKDSEEDAKVSTNSSRSEP